MRRSNRRRYVVIVEENSLIVGKKVLQLLLQDNRAISYLLLVNDISFGGCILRWSVTEPWRFSFLCHGVGVCGVYFHGS